MKTFVTLLVISLCTPWAFGQSKEPSVEIQLKLMKAQHKKAALQGKQQELGQKYQALVQKFNATPEVQELQKESTELQAKQTAAEKDYQAAKDEAYKQVGLDQKDYEMDEESLVFTQRAKPAPPTTSPDKK